MSVLDLTANDISCGHCKATIEGDLAQVPGVSQVEVDVDSKAVHVTYDDGATSAEAIKAKLVDIGYPAD
jgi:copper chaperone